MNDDERMEALMKSTMDTIIEHGHQVISVFPTEEHPGVTFAYTIGRTLKGRPELLMNGLPPHIMGRLLNDAAGLDDGETPLEAGQERHDVLVGYPVRIISADPQAAQMLQATRLFGDDVTALQILWPDADGRFPGEGFSYGDENQPMYEVI